MEPKFHAFRKPIRLKLNEGIKAEMRLMDERGGLLTSSTGTVVLMNISQEGLSFICPLRLPVHKQYLVDLQLIMAGVSLNLRGHVVWRENRDNSFLYGLAFHPRNRLKAVIIRLLNQEVLRQSPQQYRIHQLYRRLNYTVPRALDS